MASTLFSWGYYGWGNATPQLIEAVDAVEQSRGFKPPLFVDIRIRRTVRAKGFQGSAFEKLLGPARHRWMKSLGNRYIETHAGPFVQIADPSAAEELLDLALESAKHEQRILFFCSCEFPRMDGKLACHRDEVSTLLLKAAGECKQSVEAVEWPGGAPAELDLDMTQDEFKMLRSGRRTIPIGQSTDPSMCGLPWGSIATAKRGDESIYMLTGPARFERGEWQLPVFHSDATCDVSHEEMEGLSAQLRELWGMNARTDC